MKYRFILWFFVFAGCSGRCGAQEGIKIISIWSNRWDVGSSVTYIDGDRERSEGYWGQGDGASLDSISLRECGVWSASYTIHGGVLYVGKRESLKPSESIGKGIIHVEIESVDTGERRAKFGSIARHIITKEKFDFSKSSCANDEISHTYDGWYTDWPYSNKCSEAQQAIAAPSFDCADQVIVERKGQPPSGFAVKMNEEMEEKSGTFATSEVVKSITHESLDPALFAKPLKVLPESEYGKQRKQE